MDCLPAYFGLWTFLGYCIIRSLKYERAVKCRTCWKRTEHREIHGQQRKSLLRIRTWNAYEILIPYIVCFKLMLCILFICLDRLDFSGQPNLTQWIKTISQQIKALYLLRDEDCASKSEEMCIFVCENVIIFMEKTEYFGSTTVELRDGGKSGKNILEFQFLVMCSCTFL